MLKVMNPILEYQFIQSLLRAFSQRLGHFHIQ